MPASLRVIKIVQDPVTKEEAYTLEFEVMSENAKDLLNELSKSRIGQQLIELVNRARFLPDPEPEDVKKKLEEEEKEREIYEEELVLKAIAKVKAKENAGISHEEAVAEVCREIFGEKGTTQIVKVDEVSSNNDPI